MEKDKTPDKAIELTEEQEQFCYLYVYGDSEFAGQHVNCYRETHGDVENISVISRKLIAQPHILAKINELVKTLQTEIENTAVKLQVAETLKAVMEETATTHYMDKSGVSLSPAPLRAVSVNAAKALMDLYPIKHAAETRLKIEGSEGGIIFNVVVPEVVKKDED